MGFLQFPFLQLDVWAPVNDTKNSQQCCQTTKDRTTATPICRPTAKQIEKPS